MSNEEFREASELRLKVENDGTGLSQSLAEQIRGSIRSGTLAAGDRLPSSRDLAKQIGVARGTISSAYELLLAEGLLESRVGSGTFVSIPMDYSKTSDEIDYPDVKAKEIPEPNADPLQTCKIDLRPCRPSVAEFPLNTWRKCMANAASRALQSDYGSALGPAALRESLSAYLRRARGLQADPDEIIVTNGAVHAMYLFARVMLRPRSRVYFEDPGYPLARQTFSLAGGSIVDSKVDQEGLVLHRLPSRVPSGSFVYVTPSHQFPTGSRLSLKRRHALIAWARESDAMVVEDDYDGEYRFDVPPLPPLASVGRDRVLYCGTFSKTMFPAIRIGFAVGPKSVITAMAKYRTITEYAPNAQVCTALAQFIDDGSFERHIRRMRMIYRKKRECLVTAIEETNKQLSVVGIESGLNALVLLDGSLDANQIARKGLASGIHIPPLDRYTNCSEHLRNGLVVGFAQPTEQDIRKAIAALF